MGELPRALRFDRFAVDLRTGELHKDGRRLKLQERPFQVLAALLERPGDLVSREELRLRLWPADTFVDFDNGLNTAVAKLRQALGDSVDRPRFVETLPGRGYRFVGALESPLPAAPETLAATGPDPSIDGDTASRSQPIEQASLDTAPVDSTPPPAARSPAVGRSWAMPIAFGVGVVLATTLVLAVWRGSPLPPAEHSLVFASEASHRTPSLSPDGSMVAFISTTSGSPQVWIKNLAQGDPVQVTSGDVAAASPRWSPRGDQILFDRVGQGIWSVGPLGTPAPRRLIENGRNANLSSDGTRLVFERARAIWVADPDGANPRRVDAVPLQWTSDIPLDPALSPDASSIAYFLAESGPNGDFWIVPSGGGPPRRLTNDVCAGGDPVWTPDGQSLIVWSVRGGSPNLWRVPVSGDPPSPVTSGAGEDRSPAISADGRTVVYTNVRNEWALRVIDAATGTDREILSRRSQLWLPEYSPDGARIAFFHQIGRDIHIFTVREDGTDLRQVTHGSAEWNIHPSWSPDGRYLYYYRERPGPGLRRVAAEGGTPEDVIPGWRWQSHMHARVDASGHRIAYSLQGQGIEEKTVIRDLRTGRETPLPLPHLHTLHWRGDDAIVGHRHDSTIVSCAADGSACEVITQGVRAAPPANGSPLFFQRPTSDTSTVELWTAQADGREPRKIRDVGPLAPLSFTFTASPQQHVAWTEYRPGRHELWQLAVAVN